MCENLHKSFLVSLSLISLDELKIKTKKKRPFKNKLSFIIWKYKFAPCKSTFQIFWNWSKCYTYVSSGDRLTLSWKLSSWIGRFLILSWKFSSAAGCPYRRSRSTWSNRVLLPLSADSIRLLKPESLFRTRSWKFCSAAEGFLRTCNQIFTVAGLITHVVYYGTHFMSKTKKDMPGMSWFARIISRVHDRSACFECALAVAQNTGSHFY